MNILDNITVNPNIETKKYFYNGQPVPRVTEIISEMLHEEYLMKWANSLGYKHKNYNKERESAANIGTETHKIIERFLKGEKIIRNLLGKGNDS